MHRDRGDVLELRVDVRRNGDAELRQHVPDALDGERRLAGLVAGAVEADDEAVTDELVAAHARHRGEILDAFGLGGRGSAVRQQRSGKAAAIVRRMRVCQSCSERHQRRIEEAEQPARLGGVRQRALAAIGDLRIGHAPRRDELSGSMSIGRTMPWMRTNSWPWLMAIHFWPRTSRLPFGQALHDGDGDVAVELVALRRCAVAVEVACCCRCRISRIGMPFDGDRPAGDRGPGQVRRSSTCWSWSSRSSRRSVLSRAGSSACRRRGAP